MQSEVAHNLIIHTYNLIIHTILLCLHTACCFLALSTTVCLIIFLVMHTRFLCTLLQFHIVHVCRAQTDTVGAFTTKGKVDHFVLWRVTQFLLVSFYYIALSLIALKRISLECKAGYHNQMPFLDFSLKTVFYHPCH